MKRFLFGSVVHVHTWFDKIWWPAQSTFWLYETLQSISLERTTILHDNESVHSWLFSFDRWRTRNPERWSMLLQFKHLVSDKSRAFPWMLVNTEEDKTEGAWICELLSLTWAADMMFGKWLCFCHLWDPYQVLKSTHGIRPQQTVTNSRIHFLHLLECVCVCI